MTFTTQQMALIAKNAAVAAGSDLIGPEHLFYALLNQPDGMTVELFYGMGFSVNLIKENLNNKIRDTAGTTRTVPVPNRYFQIIISVTKLIATTQNQEISETHILWALLVLGEKSFLMRFFKDEGITKQNLTIHLNAKQRVIHEDASSENVDDQEMIENLLNVTDLGGASCRGFLVMIEINQLVASGHALNQQVDARSSLQRCDLSGIFFAPPNP